MFSGEPAINYWRTVRSVRESLTLLLKPGPLTIKERRAQARAYYVLLFADGAILFILTISFPKEWIIFGVIWYLVTVTLFLWLSFKRRSLARASGIVTSPEGRAIARRELSSRLKRPIVMMSVGGILLLFAGRYNSLGYVAGGAVLLLSLWMYALMRRMR